jgi:hypothetical protein
MSSKLQTPDEQSRCGTEYGCGSHTTCSFQYMFSLSPCVDGNSSEMCHLVLFVNLRLVLLFTPLSEYEPPTDVWEHPEVRYVAVDP